MTAHRSLVLAVFLTVAPFVGGPVVAAQCDSCVLYFTGGNAQTFHVEGTFGWKFTVAPDSTITIGGLGIFDVGKDGLKESHVVGLWNSDTMSLITSATIDSAGTHVASTSSAGDWLFTALKDSVQLTKGDYVVGAFYVANSPDAFITGANLPPPTISGVTFGGARNGAGSVLGFPSTDASEGGGGFFGPNAFTAAAPPVPEPKTYAMLMAGLGLLGFMARRRRKSLNAAA